MTTWDDPLPDFRWPVAVVQPIALPATDVWGIISTSGYLERCHPYCTRNPVQLWPGVGARDEVHYLNGWIFERRFRDWIDGAGYDLEIGRRGGRTSFVSWRIAPNGNDACQLRIAVYPHPMQALPAVVRWLPHHLRLRPLLLTYLSSVTQGIEWYATRHEPVQRNQFGRHPWFSADDASGSAGA